MFPTPEPRATAWATAPKTPAEARGPSQAAGPPRWRPRIFWVHKRKPRNQKLTKRYAAEQPGYSTRILVLFEGPTVALGLHLHKQYHALGAEVKKYIKMCVSLYIYIHIGPSMAYWVYK